MNTKRFLNKHAIVTFYLIAFAISWGVITLVIGLGRFYGQAADTSQIALGLLGMVLGPVTSALVMTALLEGKAGLRDLFARVIRWKVGARWYLAATLPNALLVPAILLALAALVSPDFLPDFRAVGVLVGLVAGGFEEFGWMGFVIPRLLQKHTPLKAGLIHGVLWGVWHLWAGFLGSMPGSEGYWLVEALFFWVAGLAAYRVLMTWVYSHTQSVLLGQIQHAFLTGILFTFEPALSPAYHLIFYVAEGLGLCLIAAVVAWRSREAAAERGVLYKASV